jgi:phosphoribosylglycinamide formyltransferase-1
MQTAVLASGSGSLLDAILADGIPVRLVVVDRPCAATHVAERHGVPAVVHERTSFGPSFDRDAYTTEVADILRDAGTELVVMAGWGTVFSEPIHEAFPNRILNTHPALLPAFKGWHAVEDALAHGVKVTGCTIHVATLEMDAGPILAQEAVAVRADDTVESLHERIKAVERTLYPATIRAVLDDPTLLEDARQSKEKPT